TTAAGERIHLGLPLATAGADLGQVGAGQVAITDANGLASEDAGLRLHVELEHFVSGRHAYIWSACGVSRSKKMGNTGSRKLLMRKALESLALRISLNWKTVPA